MKARSKAAKRAPKTALKASVAQVYRAAILEAAERIFGSAGFEKAKMADIAREAGLAAGTLYNYFESKEEIFRSLLSYRGDTLLQRFTEMKPKPNFREDALQLIRGLYQHLEQHQGMFAIFLQLGVNTEWSFRRLAGEEVCERHDKFRQLFQGIVARGVKRGELRKDVPASELVALLNGCMQGMINAWLNGDTKGPLADKAERVVDAFLRGVGKE